MGFWLLLSEHSVKNRMSLSEYRQRSKRVLPQLIQDAPHYLASSYCGVIWMNSSYDLTGSIDSP
jgi:hypothetical protein